jgi:hypothetical protein
MTLQEEDLIKEFDQLFTVETQISDLKKGIKDSLASFADSNVISKRSVSSAYALYKRYKTGKLGIDSDQMSLEAMVDMYFTQTNPDAVGSGKEDEGN